MRQNVDVPRGKLVAKAGGAACAVLAVVLVAGCGGSDGDAGSAAEEPLKVQLAEQNGSGQSGSATFMPLGGDRTRIVMELNGSPAAQQPAHVHSGSCDDLGDAVVGLTDLEDGRSTTVADVGLAELERGDLVIHAHKSEAEFDVSVACAPVTRAGP